MRCDFIEPWLGLIMWLCRVLIIPEGVATKWSRWSDYFSRAEKGEGGRERKNSLVKVDHFQGFLQECGQRQSDHCSLPLMKFIVTGQLTTCFGGVADQS